MLGDEEDVFDSVTWESPSATYDTDHTVQPSGPGFKQSTAGTEDERGPHDPKWEGYLIVTVKDPVKELAETKDAYVSYLVSAKVCHNMTKLSCIILKHLQTNLPIFSTPNPSSRRRFQDFVFLRDHLVKDFPACVVPALPDKHRLGICYPPDFDIV
jgi:sorting nexin-4